MNNRIVFFCFSLMSISHLSLFCADKNHSPLPFSVFDVVNSEVFAQQNPDSKENKAHYEHMQSLSPATAQLVRTLAASKLADFGSEKKANTPTISSTSTPSSK